MSDEKKCESCQSETCAAKAKTPRETQEEFESRQALARRMCRIKHKVLVLSGKGGVGKSTVAANLAVSLAAKGNAVGILDVDIHGPSVPKMLGVENAKLRPGSEPESILPIQVSENLKAMSIGFTLANPDDALIWRGPMKMGVVQQFLKDVEWGDLDYLVIDLPPGTGDEPLSICQLIENPDGAVVVTTPQEVSLVDVRKSINFCRKLELDVLGVIENMSGFTCPKCGEVTHIFKSGGAEKMCEEMGVNFLGSVPLDPRIVEAADSGKLADASPEISAIFAEPLKTILNQP